MYVVGTVYQDSPEDIPYYLCGCGEFVYVDQKERHEAKDHEEGATD